jgi:uncharacterized protein involved in exopolysaccharide biosynthesis
MSVLNLANRHRRMILGLALGISALAVGFALIGQRSYTSSGSFLPQSSNSRPSTLAGVAAQFGLTVQSDQSGDSPDFYATILKSRPTLEQVVQERYTLKGSNKTSNLIDLLAPTGFSLGQRREAAIAGVNSRTTVAIVREIGLVRVSATAADPGLAQQIVENLFRYANETNLDLRRQRAADEARFIDERLGEARSNLYAAEDRLQSFLRSNRDLGSASEGTFQRERLERDVQMKQQIYTSLALAYEQSRLDEVRNTSVISVVERPSLPLFPNPRHLGAKGLLAAGVGALLGLALAWLAERGTLAGATRNGGLRRFLAFRARSRRNGGESPAERYAHSR